MKDYIKVISKQELEDLDFALGCSMDYLQNEVEDIDIDTNFPTDEDIEERKMLKDKFYRLWDLRVTLGNKATN